MARFALCARALLALAALLAGNGATAAESYDNCTGYITSLPATISTQGTWCLKQDLSTAITSGQAIAVATNNVTIDCNDFKIGGLAAGAGTATSGIAATAKFNVTVRHCNIRGFFIGIYFSGGGGGHAIEDNRFDGNTAYGMFVDGAGSVIRRNRLFDTGDSTGTADAYGIYLYDSGDIIDNTVSNVIARAGGNGTAYGIYTEQNVSGRINGNGVGGITKDGTGFSYGIYNYFSQHIVMRDNDVIGSTGTVGLRCTDSNGSARQNVISSFTTAIESCTDSGGNAVIP